MIDFNRAYNRETFLNFLSNQFLPDDFEQNIIDIDYTHGVISKITELGYCPSLKELVVYEVIHTSKNDARITLTREIFRFMKNNTVQYALVVFVPKDNKDVYRFSFIKMSPTFDEKSGKLDFKKSNPKRYSFLLGLEQHTRTPKEELIYKDPVKDINDLSKRFSIEVLTKEFYKELFSWYETAVNVAKFPKNPPTKKKREHIIRLITRLMFVWFIKQHYLVPADLFEKTEIEKQLKNFNPLDENDGAYYNAILQNLFFGALNCEIENRSFARDSKGQYSDRDYQIRNKFRDRNGNSYFSVSHEEIEKLFSNIPFLNGGLFECLIENEHQVDDGFSRDPTKQAFIPNHLFFDEETGILSILKKYNWTIEENSPDDVDVALDPELLGKVFENLLGTYNPETKETARKESGSFYTPREIVQYMVDKSLVEYLEAKTVGYLRGKSSDPAGDAMSRVLFLITELDIPSEIKQDKEYLEIVEEALKNIKVLDPACGSGAFPMGILNRIVEIISKIKGELTSKERYQLKLNLIKNCIYGADIQPIAIQIAKLRFFIALTSEQEKTGGEKNNYGIDQLPNLETKLVAADTLIELNSGISTVIHRDEDQLNKYKEEIRKIRSDELIKAKTYQKKKALREKDQNLCNSIKTFIDEKSRPDKENITAFENEINRLKHERESIKVKNKNVVSRGNAYFLFEEHHSKAPIYFDENKERIKEIDRKIRVCEEKLSKEYNKKINASSLLRDIHILVDWNPYQPTAAAKFFDPKWMFGLDDNFPGFDLVIGNPPYLHLEDLKKKPIHQEYEAQKYASWSARGDLYQLFYERGLDLLRENGHLCYITSNKWLRAGYGEKSRKLFTQEYYPKLLLDLGGNIFESATVDTNILLIQNASYDDQLTLSWTCEQDDDLEKMSDLIQQNGQKMHFDRHPWVILSPIEQSIKAKIEAKGTPLKDWDISINYGIKTGCNEAFIISGAKRQELIAQDPKSAEIIRPILRGRDIKKYGYEFANLYLIATFPSRHYDIDDFAAIKNYLENFGKDDNDHLKKWGEDCWGKRRLGQTGKPGARKKTNNKWFETQDSINYWDI